MSDLVERYLHSVGAWLPPRDRDEIKAELRSLIMDQLEDRFGPAPTTAEVATILAEMGHPAQMAASYHTEQALVGPTLFPFMRIILQQGVLLVVAVVVFLNVFAIAAAHDDRSVLPTLIDMAWNVVQVTLWFSAVVVFIFALLERSKWLSSRETVSFDPEKLPKRDDPLVIDRAETIGGVVIGVLFSMLLLYFLSVGGLTLDFSQRNPQGVVDVPDMWLIILMLSGFGMIAIHVYVLMRDRWLPSLYFAETLLEVSSTVFLYLALTEPLLTDALADNPSLHDIPLIAYYPEIFAIGYAVLALLNRSTKLRKMLNALDASPFR